MRQVIDGKAYDTDGATLIHQWSNGHNAGDFHRCDETLYQTKKGASYIAGGEAALSAWPGRSCCPGVPGRGCGGVPP